MIADHFNETALLPLPDGRILAIARSHIGGYLATCFSPDQGRTWTAPRRITADREHPADVILLEDNRLLLVYGERNRPFGVRAALSGKPLLGSAGRRFDTLRRHSGGKPGQHLRVRRAYDTCNEFKCTPMIGIKR